MSILAGVAVASPDFALGEALSNGETNTRVELTQFVPIDGDLVPYFWLVDSEDQEEYERQVRADPRVERLADLDGGVDRTLYRIEWAERLDGFLDALRDNAVIVENARGNADEWVFRLRADTQQALSEFQDDCFDAGVRLDVRRMVDDTDSAGSDIYGVTDERAGPFGLASSTRGGGGSKPAPSARVSGYFRNYCEECGWSASTETNERGELAAAAIKHVTATGHDVDSEVIADLKEPL